MKKTRSTKRALLLSALSLLLCLSMFVGSTFAWFTDSVTSSGNKIQSGKLELDLEVLDINDNTTWTSLRDNPQPLFDYNKWEPGYTEIKVLKVENEGTLALKWIAKIVSEKQLSKLAEVIDVYVLPSETTALTYPTNRDLTGYTKVGTLKDFANTIETTTKGVLEPNAKAYLGIALKMQETAGNEYQELDLGGAFDIQILATQYTSESDSFGIDYDTLAAFPYYALGKLTAGDSAVELEIRDKNETKVGSAVVPNGAIDNADLPVEVNIEKSNHKANISVAAGQETTAFEVTVSNLKPGNTTPVKVALRIAAGLDPATVQLYHYDTLITSTYNPETGYVTFESTEFSPFTVVYDAESTYVPPVALPEALPTASVAPYTPAEAIVWGNYGAWSPTEGLEANLDAIYKFACTETLDEAKANPYANWNCDFYVKLDRDLGANEIFLGGNYGSFGWVGFHNGDLTLEANTELGLLESVTTNPWTYVDVVQNVGEFICGVGNVGDSLQGATFTVMLRLTNPDNAAEFYNVATINYTFN